MRKRGGKNDFSRYGVFKCYLPEQGSRADSSVFAVDLLALSTGTSSILICSAFSGHSYCSCPTNLFSTWLLEWTWIMNLTGPPLFKGENFMLLAWRDKNLLCSNSCLQLDLVLCPVFPVVFQASSRYLQGFSLFFPFLCTPVDSCLLFPDSLGKADPSLRFLSFSCVLRCSWHRWCISLFIRLSFSRPRIKRPCLVDHDANLPN